jgi:hypothetical protein
LKKKTTKSRSEEVSKGLRLVGAGNFPAFNEIKVKFQDLYEQIRSVNRKVFWQRRGEGLKAGAEDELFTPVLAECKFNSALMCRVNLGVRVSF